jgi:hypothetical protein
MRASFLFGFALVACGGTMTTVDGNENTQTLPTADKDQLCLDTYNYVRNNFSTDDLAKLECGFSQSPTQDPSACQTAYQSCLTTARANVQQIQWPLVPDCTSFDQSVASCNTTVSEYTKCLQEELDAVKAMEGDFPFCTQAAEEQAALAAASHLSQDCITLLQTCHPAFAPSSSGSNGGPPDAGPPDGG